MACCCTPTTSCPAPRSWAIPSCASGQTPIVRYDMLRRALAGRADVSHRRRAGCTVITPARRRRHLLPHRPVTPPEARFETLATVDLDVGAGTLAAHPGGPCTAPAALAAPTHPHASTASTEGEDRCPHLCGSTTWTSSPTTSDSMVDFYHVILGLPFHLPYEPEEEWAAIEAGQRDPLHLQVRGGRACSAPHGGEPGERARLRLLRVRDGRPGRGGGRTGRSGRVGGRAYQWKHPNGTWYRYRPFFDPEGNMLYITEPHIAGADA